MVCGIFFMCKDERLDFFENVKQVLKPVEVKTNNDTY